jgi:hypothetical protein
MKNIRFLYDNWVDSATLTASSANANFPVANIKHPWYTRHWRTTGVSAESCIFDLTSAKAVQAFVWKYHNLGANAVVHVQGNATNSWGAPYVDVTVPIIAGQLVYFWDTPQTYQYWRVTFGDAGNSDGYLRCGRPYFGPYFSPTVNFANDYTKRIVDPSDIVESYGGQESANLKTRYKEFGYSWSANNPISKADSDTLTDIFYTYVGKSVSYFLCQDADLKDTTTYYVRNTSDWDIPHIFMETYFGFHIDVKEAR